MNAVGVREGQVRIDEDGTLYKVVEVDGEWCWIRLMHRWNRTLHGRPKRVEVDYVAQRWLQVVL